MSKRISVVYCFVLLAIAPTVLAASAQGPAVSSSSLPAAEGFAPGVISRPANDGSMPEVANGSSNDAEARLGPDHRSIYFTSDRAIPVPFPGSEAQAMEGTQRLELWDNSNSNIWMILLNVS